MVYLGAKARMLLKQIARRHGNQVGVLTLTRAQICPQSHECFHRQCQSPFSPGTTFPAYMSVQFYFTFKDKAVIILHKNIYDYYPKSDYNYQVKHTEIKFHISETKIQPFPPASQNPISL